MADQNQAEASSMGSRPPHMIPVMPSIHQMQVGLDCGQQVSARTPASNTLHIRTAHQQVLGATDNPPQTSESVVCHRQVGPGGTEEDSPPVVRNRTTRTIVTTNTKPNAFKTPASIIRSLHSEQHSLILTQTDKSLAEKPWQWG